MNGSFKNTTYIVGNFKKSFSFLHLVGLRPQVYYTFTSFKELLGQGPLACHPLNTPMDI